MCIAESAGSGPPLVFVHGSGGSARQWKRLFRHFASTRRVFAYDLPGHSTSLPVAAVATGFAFADDARILCAAIERLGEPADVVAHSAGAVGVLLAARDHPQVLRTLTLFEPVLFQLLRDAADPAFGPVAAYARAFRRLYEQEGAAPAMELFVDLWNGPESWGKMPSRSAPPCLPGPGT